LEPLFEPERSSPPWSSSVSPWSLSFPWSSFASAWSSSFSPWSSLSFPWSSVASAWSSSPLGPLFEPDPLEALPDPLFPPWSSNVA